MFAISADSHVTEPGDCYVPRIDPRFRDRAPRAITHETMGVEVRTDMETLVVGTSPIGLPIHFDRNAHAADGIMLLNRVKPHTDFHAAREPSGNASIAAKPAVGIG